MSELYYTPEPEEFHIGFEYEFNTTFLESQYGPDDEFMETSIEDPDDLALSFEHLERNGCRVKYLDKEDIESLGFEEYADSPSLYHLTDERVFEQGGELFIKSNGGTNIHLNVDYWKLFVYGEYIQIYDLQENLVYKGRCKNKSKLKSILKDVGFFI